MNRLVAWLCLTLGTIVLTTGCTTAPVDRAGISGAITVRNTNPDAIRRAALPAFARYGYSPGRGTTAQALFFERPSAQPGERLLGTPPTTTNLGVRLQLLPMAHDNDFRLVVQVTRVNLAGPTADSQSMRLWQSQFDSILREIRSQAENVGPRG